MTDPKCGICGAAVDYQKEGRRWSSIRGDENGVEGVRTCSDICRNTPKCAALIADYEKPLGLAAKKRAKKSKKSRQVTTCVFCCVQPCKC